MSTARVAIQSISAQQKDVVTRRLPPGSPAMRTHGSDLRPNEAKTVSEVVGNKGHTSNGLIFSDYVRALKDAWTGDIGDADLIELLYGLIANPLNLKGQTGEPIRCQKKDASGIMNRKREAHGKIREHCRDAAIESTIVDSFEKAVLPRLNESKFDILRRTLTDLILESECSQSTKEGRFLRDPSRYHFPGKIKSLHRLAREPRRMSTRRSLNSKERSNRTFLKI